MIGASALAIYGITRKSPLGLALAAAGGTIALVSATHPARERQSRNFTSLLVNCSPEEAYRFWRDFDNLPRFMRRLENVTVLDNRRSRWTALGPMGTPVTWEAEITDERENEHIAWRSLPGSDVQVNGHVTFTEAPAGRGTLITAYMAYHAPAGMPDAAARFLNKGMHFAIRQDLRRLEALLETGEIPTTEGQPHGPRDVATGIMRVMDPTRPIRRDSNLKEVFTESRRTA